MSYLTDSEKRILFSALSREKVICEELDKSAVDSKERVKLTPIVESLERKFYYGRFEREIWDKAVDDYKTVLLERVKETALHHGTYVYIDQDDVNETAKQIKRSAERDLTYDEENDRNAKNVKFIADTYGYDPQSRQCIEEMAELTQAINKFWRKQLKCGKQPMIEQMKESAECKHIVEEIADVQLMLWNMIYLLDADIQPIMREKLDRQLQRIKESGK